MGNYWVFLPETILVVVALSSVVLGFWWQKRPSYLWGLALLGTLAALLITLDMMGLGLSAALGLHLWPSSPLGSQGDFTAAYYIFSMQRAIFGPLNTKWEKYPDMQDHEVLPLSVLAVAMAIFGIVPIVIYQLITPWALHVLAGIPAII